MLPILVKKLLMTYFNYHTDLIDSSIAFSQTVFTNQFIDVFSWLLMVKFKVLNFAKRFYWNLQNVKDANFKIEFLCIFLTENWKFPESHNSREYTTQLPARCRQTLMSSLLTWPRQIYNTKLFPIASMHINHFNTWLCITGYE